MMSNAWTSFARCVFTLHFSNPQVPPYQDPIVENNSSLKSFSNTGLETRHLPVQILIGNQCNRVNSGRYFCRETEMLIWFPQLLEHLRSGTKYGHQQWDWAKNGHVGVYNGLTCSNQTDGFHNPFNCKEISLPQYQSYRIRFHKMPFSASALSLNLSGEYCAICLCLGGRQGRVLRNLEKSHLSHLQKPAQNWSKEPPLSGIRLPPIHDEWRVASCKNRIIFCIKSTHL